MQRCSPAQIVHAGVPGTCWASCLPQAALLDAQSKLVHSALCKCHRKHARCKRSSRQESTYPRDYARNRPRRFDRNPGSLQCRRVPLVRTPRETALSNVNPMATGACKSAALSAGLQGQLGPVLLVTSYCRMLHNRYVPALLPARQHGSWRAVILLTNLTYYLRSAFTRANGALARSRSCTYRHRPM
jgi:hypothetical protein